MTIEESELVIRLRAAGCVFAEEEARLLRHVTADDEALEELVAQRVSGVPLEYLLGWVEFRGVRVGIRPGVFVPRRRTEFLVEVAARHARTLAGPRSRTVLDLCCGSGALGLTLTEELTEARIDVRLAAADIDPVAVACAADNLAALRAQVYCGDLFAPLPAALRGRVDILLCNTPYVPTESIARMPSEAREHEPRVALDGGADGLDVLRRVAAEVTTWLAPNGLLLVESGSDQASAAIAVLECHGLRGAIETSDEYDATVVTGAARATCAR